MATARENARSASMRADILSTLTNGVSLSSPTAYCLMNGVPTGVEQPASEYRSMKNVLWGRGGSSFDWRHRMYRSKATQSTGPLRVRSFSEKDLFAKPTVSTYMFDQTWGVGEGDLEDNRHAGPQKQIDLKKENLQDAAEAIYAEIALSIWAINETNQAGGLTMFSPTAHGASTTYAGIAMDATTSNGTDTFYYWRPQGYDYGTNAIGSYLIAHLAALKQQMTFSLRSGGQGGFDVPDCGVMDPTMWPYVINYFEGKASYNIEKVTKLSILEGETKVPNVVIHGMPLFPDDNFGGATGYVDGSATEEIMLLTSSKFRLVTTHTKAEGLISLHSTSKDDMAWLAGQAGVAVTGKQAPVFLDPRGFQILYT